MLGRYDESRFWYLHELRQLRAAARIGHNTKTGKRIAQKKLSELRKEHYMTDAATVRATKPVKTPRGRTFAGYPLTATITFLTDKDGKKYGPDNNPKRVNSNAAKMFAKYIEGMTLEAFASAGGRPSAIKYDVAHNLISVA